MMSFSELFPGMATFVANLKDIPPGSIVAQSQWLYTVFGVTHLLTLALLGGAVILLNMRMLGVGATTVPAADLERGLRPYLWIGVVGVLFSGVVIGWANAEKLYVSTPFLVKMLSLAGALIFSFGVANAAANSEDGSLSASSKGMAILAFLLWLASILMFTAKGGSNPGVMHAVTAAAVILLAFARPATRLIGLIITGILVLVYVIVGYVVLGGVDGDFDAFMNLTKGCAWAAAAASIGLIGYEVFTGHTEEDKGPMIKLIAVFSIICWVTVVAAGRWIGLSP